MDKIASFSRQAMCCKQLYIHHHRCMRWKQLGSLDKVIACGILHLPRFHQCHDDTSSNASKHKGIIQEDVKEGKNKERSDIAIGDNGLTFAATQNNSVKSLSLDQENTRKSVGDANATISASNTSQVGTSSVSSSSQNDGIKGNNSSNEISEKTLVGDDDDKTRRKEPPVAPDPETCCESGCVNCVWIKYAEEVKDYYPDNQERLKEILDLIEDYNVKMFIRMELGIKK